jgi:hypothetical protein
MKLSYRKRALNNLLLTTPVGVVRPLLAEVGLCKWLILQGAKMVERAYTAVRQLKFNTALQRAEGHSSLRFLNTNTLKFIIRTYNGQCPHLHEIDLQTESKFAFQPRYNLAPSQDAPIILEEDGKKATMMRWGLIPVWAKEPSIGYKMINARAEGQLT